MAAAALSNLAKDAENQVTLVVQGAGPTMLQLLDESAREAHEIAASAIVYLVTLASQGTGPKLLRLLAEGLSEGRMWASTAIANLANNAVNQVTLAAQGAGGEGEVGTLQVGTSEASGQWADIGRDRQTYT